MDKVKPKVEKVAWATDKAARNRFEGGTTAWKQEVEQRKEQLPRMPTEIKRR